MFGIESEESILLVDSRNIGAGPCCTVPYRDEHSVHELRMESLKSQTAYTTQAGRVAHRRKLNLSFQDWKLFKSPIFVAGRQRI